jgi:hypothetical protein
MSVKREQKKPRWTSPTHVCEFDWPDWVPMLEDDEIDSRDPYRSLLDWVNAVFPERRDPRVRDIVIREVARWLTAFHSIGPGRGPLRSFKLPKWQHALAWNMAMQSFGYVVQADDCGK